MTNHVEVLGNIFGFVKFSNEELKETTSRYLKRLEDDLEEAGFESTTELDAIRDDLVDLMNEIDEDEEEAKELIEEALAEVEEEESTE